MTVAKNIGYGLRLRGQSRKDIRKKIDELIELVHLEEHRDKYPAQLSGGQQQRVAIARRSLMSPKCFFSTSRSERSIANPYAS